MKKWLWLYSSILVPFFFCFSCSGGSLPMSLRAAFTGGVLSLIIYTLWKFSLRVHGVILPERHAGFLIACSALLLWAVWFAVAQVVLIAYDELPGR